MKREHQDFFVELLAHCKLYNVELGGCGCCGSPWVKFKSDGAYYDDLGVTPERLSAFDQEGVDVITFELE